MLQTTLDYLACLKAGDELSFSCPEVNGGASINSTFLFQLFNICASRVEQHRLAMHISEVPTHHVPNRRQLLLPRGLHHHIAESIVRHNSAPVPGTAPCSRRNCLIQSASSARSASTVVCGHREPSPSHSFEVRSARADHDAMAHLIDAAVIHPRHAARLVRQHRLDHGPFVVAEFVAQDSRLRFRNLNHISGSATNPQYAVACYWLNLVTKDRGCVKTPAELESLRHCFGIGDEALRRR